MYLEKRVPSVQYAYLGTGSGVILSGMAGVGGVEILKCRHSIDGLYSRKTDTIRTKEMFQLHVWFSRSYMQRQHDQAWPADR